MLSGHWLICTGLAASILSLVPLVLVYLFHVNRLLNGVPAEVQTLSGPRWTTGQLRKEYDDMKKHPLDYTRDIPPKIDRRYIVTGGNGLVGGYLVLQLLARGTPPLNIRIIDIRRPERNDMATDEVAAVEFIQTDIRSPGAVSAAFNKSWDDTIAHLPLTVFHTAAIILASDRCRQRYEFPHAVNVQGTENVLAAAKTAGADVFSSTSSASISIKPVAPWVPIWVKSPKYFWQILDEQDFDRPLGGHEDFFSNYSASKATAERIVCAENTNDFRTGCIRPANGVYGNPTDNTVGGPLSRSVFPTWIPHIVQNFVHGANVAIAHLQHEAALLSQDHVDSIPQAGRPFLVTDPNPPITYNDVYTAISTLSIHPFRLILLPPVLMLILSHIVEWYSVLPYRIPFFGRLIPDLGGDIKHLQPGIFSICTHLVASDAAARKPIAQGGLGYKGVFTTIQGIVIEILEWNREHADQIESPSAGTPIKKKVYTTSVALADQLRQVVKVGGDTAW